MNIGMLCLINSLNKILVKKMVSWELIKIVSQANLNLFWSDSHLTLSSKAFFIEYLRLFLAIYQNVAKNIFFQWSIPVPYYLRQIFWFLFTSHFLLKNRCFLNISVEFWQLITDAGMTYALLNRVKLGHLQNIGNN